MFFIGLARSTQIEQSEKPLGKSNDHDLAEPTNSRKLGNQETFEFMTNQETQKNQYIAES